MTAKLHSIAHVVDYFMPSMGYQESQLPVFNLNDWSNVFVLTSDRYQPVLNYAETWEPVLGPRVVGQGSELVRGVKIERLPVRFEFRSKPWIKNLWMTLDRYNPEVVFCHGSSGFSTLISGFWALKRKRLFLVDNHMVFCVKSNSVMGRCLYWLWKHSAARFISFVAFRVFGVTEESCKFLHQVEGIPQHKISYLPLGVDLNIFSPKENFSGELRYGGKCRIVQTGRLTEEKRPEWLASAVLQLLRDGIDCELTYVGSMSERLKNEICLSFSSTGHRSRLKFMSFRDLPGLVEVFRDHDIAVYPEGTSLSAIEAAACGCGVVMADYEASISRARSGVGVVYKTGDISSLKSVLKFLIVEKRSLTRMRLNGVIAVKSHFGYESISRNLAKLVRTADAV